MKITVTTTYDNCDDQFVDWYLNNLSRVPENLKVKSELLKTGRSKVVTSEAGMIATSVYKLEED